MTNGSRGLARIGAAGVSAVVCIGMIAAVPSDGIATRTWDARTASSARTATGGTAEYAKTQTVYALTNDDGTMGDLIVDNVFDVTGPGTIEDVTGAGTATGTDANAAVQRAGTVQRLDAAQPGTLTSRTILPAGAKALPWTVTVSYSLNGPDADARTVTGADGLVGIRIRVEPNPLADTRYGCDDLPLVTFTVPHDVTSNVAVSDGAVVSDDGDDHRVAMLGAPGVANEWDCYLTAKSFRLGRLIVAAVPADNGDTAGAGDASAVRDRLTALAAGTSALASTGDGAGDDGAYADVIGELQTLRDQERAKAAGEVQAKHDAYVSRFGVYIDRYVRSYAAHMSGTPGTKTQMGALIGMTGELTGDTPLSQSVSDLASAVNEMSAAHEHEGAADVIDEVIRRIRQRGTSGLAADLTVRQGKEAAAGKSQYSEGQGQLANAMIPFSMAYTDAFTAHRNDGLGVDAAIAQTNADFGGGASMQRYTTQISAALKTMANASKRTGAGAMLGTIVDRYGARFDAEAASADAGAGGGAGATDGGDAKVAAAGGDGIAALGSNEGSPFPGTASAAAGGAAGIRPSDPTLLLEVGQSDLFDRTATLSECGAAVTAATDLLLPEGKEPSDAVKAVLAGTAGASGAVRAYDAAALSSDVVSRDNTHTTSASFLIVLPEVGDPDAIAAAGTDGSAGTQIPGLGAIVGKFMG
ncbi:hypothetical protein G1C96_1958 [Bifidobacterium sp. DSM 109958]|uniref:Tubuliform spidroin n=1 Tax=Bifidobacterium moraviense TaxID=2675323 RepID=A0A7Y0F3I2_9BIFI|nr:hypothetical protein [Bifidobacterium sp. DSM 109958]NMN01366.1 hypothetical protein [Bifidobacterium sp. DSM 109958]